MMIRKTGLLLLLALMALTVWQSCQSTKNSTATKLLKFNLTAGKGYDYETIVNMDQEILGQKVQMDMSTYYSMEVIADSGNSRTIEAKIARFKLKTGAMGMNIEIDTDKPFKGDGSEKDSAFMMIGKLFGAVRDQKFTMTVNEEGKVTAVKGFENMGPAIVDSLGLDESKRDAMIAQFNKQFNSEQVIGQFDRFWNIFPNKEVKIGESWNRESRIGGNMPGNYKSTYTVKEIEGDVVTLEEKTSISTKENEMEMKGDISGTLIVDSKLGLVMDASQDLSMKAEANGMKMEITGKMKTKGKAR